MSDSHENLMRGFIKNGKVSSRALIDAFREAGIRQDDPRAKTLFSRMNEFDEVITEEQFASLALVSPALFDKVLSGQLAIPQFGEFCRQLEQIFEKVRNVKDGKLPNYIPQLERVDPEKFSLSVCTIDGQSFSMGDEDDSYCVQSCSKPITYCLALEEHGEEEVHQYVGQEPSGKTFNELALNSKGLPHNPMINAGAIMCGALIKSCGAAADRFDYVMTRWKEAAGGLKIGFDNAVYLSERQTADRNFALGYFMKEKKAFPSDVDLLDVLDFYFQCCSIEVTTRSMSVIAATLANGGTCPITGVQVFRPASVKNCLSLMSSCGMYDFSGEFAFRVGIPAKSGVSGAIMLVVPNVVGLAVWSPRLDELGNSVRGVEFCRQLVSRFKFHTFDSTVGLVDDRVDPRRNSYESRFGGVNALLWAASEGDVPEMRKLIAGGVSVQAANYDGRTALHLAASEGRVPAICYLLELGADAGFVDRWGNTALDDAIQSKNEAAISMLKEHTKEQSTKPSKHLKNSN